jgi:ribosome maturation factor RimP
MSGKKVTGSVRELLEGFLADNGFELYNIEYIKEGKDWFLRVFIDRLQDGAEETAVSVGTDDCELVSRYLSDRLDELDPIAQNYYLEVCSPGLDRELLKDADFARFAGRAVTLSLYRARDGRKTIRGTLEGLDDGDIVIRGEDGAVIRTPRAQAAKTRLDF